MAICAYCVTELKTVFCSLIFWRFLFITPIAPNTIVYQIKVFYSNLSSNFTLTHLSRMDFHTLISRTSPFPILRVLGGVFHFYSNSNRTLCEHTVETLIRRRVLWRLIWVCTVCLCPTKKTLCLYGLMVTFNG